MKRFKASRLCAVGLLSRAVFSRGGCSIGGALLLSIDFCSIDRFGTQCSLAYTIWIFIDLDLLLLLHRKPLSLSENVRQIGGAPNG
jgi:hypothetical protein